MKTLAAIILVSVLFSCSNGNNSKISDNKVVNSEEINDGIDDDYYDENESQIIDIVEPTLIAKVVNNSERPSAELFYKGTEDIVRINELNNSQIAWLSLINLFCNNYYYYCTPINKWSEDRDKQVEAEFKAVILNKLLYIISNPNCFNDLLRDIERYISSNFKLTDENARYIRSYERQIRVIMQSPSLSYTTTKDGPLLWIRVYNQGTEIGRSSWMWDKLSI